MKQANSEYFHKLYGAKSSRLVYRGDDFLDYLLMTVLTGGVAAFVYGPMHPMTILALGLCAWMVVAFLVRHGFQWRIPTIVRHPQEVLYMLVYKVQNMRLTYVIAAALLALENYVIAMTPELPHNVELMRKIGFGLFYTHFIVLTLYRTAILIAHLRGRAHVREFLMQTSWRAVLNRQPSITLEILHAYFTGLLTHVLLIAPWYLAITYFNFSLIFLPATFVAGFFIHSRFLRVVNEWFYRDHWLGHHSELEFLYMHGPHHDAIPSGLIGVSGNGYLEGVARHTMGGPGIFYNPVVTFLIHCFDVKVDIDGHQFIPGIYPHVPKSIQMINQHSTHHFGKLEPYGLGLNLDQPGIPEEILQRAKVFSKEQQNAIQLDMQLTGFKWDNPRYLEYLELYEKYLTVKTNGSSSAETVVETESASH
ncbi:MAG TPA: hypothetical protein VEC06_13400 [Paucimonas sp.]|nr:hypothetical protein [Paucimonas sp.]